MSNWLDFFSNPRGHHLKKAMFEILQEKYEKNEPIVDRLAVTLVTHSDMEAFLKLVVDVYESAYMKAVNDHREQLAKAGLVARVTQKDG